MLILRTPDDAADALADYPAERQIFRDTGVEALLDLRTIRRVERANHLEVWGPVVDR